MRGARLLLAISAALALSGCLHDQQYAQRSAPAPASASSRTLYSASPAYAQQAYDEPVAQTEASRVSAVEDRGLLNSSASTPPPTNSAPVGGPYVPAAETYAAVPVASITHVPADPPYTLDAGDKLRVVVFGQDGISNSYTVDASGKVNLPLVGAVNARGLTNQQLAASIATRLKQGFVREPHVSVEVETYRPFFILGEVTTPGQYPYVANLTAETAVAIAGGFAPRAFRTTVELTRKGGAEVVRREVPLDFPVRPGDTILVKERWF